MLFSFHSKVILAPFISEIGPYINIQRALSMSLQNIRRFIRGVIFRNSCSLPQVTLGDIPISIKLCTV